MFRDDDIIFLLGAGCSVEAGIPSTTEMIADIEKKIRSEDSDWGKYKNIYNLTKASIFYSRGIRGIYNHSLNIEEVVNILNELIKQDEIPLLPFIGTWNPKLTAIAGDNFNNIKKFRDMIVDQLKNWIDLESYNDSKYYKGFFNFQQSLEFPLRIFSLNYDLCLEETIKEKQLIERGFDPDKRSWHWSRFDVNPNEAKIFLYKLHGSIDWKRDKNGNVLKEVHGNFNKPELIFGTNYKLQYIDPYLFYTYEFRKWSLECKYIIVIGYGFNDEHINGILKQAVETNDKRTIVVVSKNNTQDNILKALNLSNQKSQIVVPEGDLSAKQFLENLSIEKLSSMIGVTTDTNKEIEEFLGDG